MMGKSKIGENTLRSTLNVCLFHSCAILIVKSAVVVPFNYSALEAEAGGASLLHQDSQGYAEKHCLENQKVPN